MEYYFDSGFTIVNKNRYTNLIKYLFQHYDQFVAEVIGGDFEHSVFRNVLYPTAQYEYDQYRRDRIFYYTDAKQYGTPHHLKALIPFEEFKLTFKPPIIHAELSTLRLFIYGIDQIMLHNSIVHDHMGKCFKLYGNGDELFKAVAKEIIKKQFPNIDLNGPETPFHCPKYITTRSFEVTEFVAVYTFVFKLLKKKNLDFKYQTIPMKAFSGLVHTIEKYWVEEEIRKILKSNTENMLDDGDMELISQNRLEAARQAELKRMLELPVIVEAYFMVYDQLPANYPSEQVNVSGF